MAWESWLGGAAQGQLGMQGMSDQQQGYYYPWTITTGDTSTTTATDNYLNSYGTYFFPAPVVKRSAEAALPPAEPAQPDLAWLDKRVEEVRVAL